MCLRFRSLEKRHEWEAIFAQYVHTNSDNLNKTMLILVGKESCNCLRQVGKYDMWIFIDNEF